MWRSRWSANGIRSARRTAQAGSSRVAYSALAGTYLNLGRTELVPGEAEKAMQANPHDPAIHLWFPMYHLAKGDYELAMQQTQRIVARWPLFWPARLYLAQILREQGDVPGAIRELERFLESDPASSVGFALGRVYMDSGDLVKARQALERVDARVRQNYRSRLTWALPLALERKTTEAFREIDDQVQAWAGISFLEALVAADVYAVLGETDKALEWVDRAGRSGDEREDWLRRDPMLKSIREHPRFQQMLASVAYRRQQRSR